MRMHHITVVNILVLFSLISVSANADEIKGIQLYKEKLEYRCGFSIDVFAHKYTKEEWKYAKGHCQLGKYMKKICPRGSSFFRSTKFRKKYSSHIYDYVIAHAE